MDVHKFLTPLPHVHFRPKIQTLPLPLTVDVLYVRPQSKIFEKFNPIPKTPVSQSKWDKIYPKSKGIGYSVPLLRWLGLRRGKKIKIKPFSCGNASWRNIAASQSYILFLISTN
jgi:hypothetical protein